MPVRQFKLFPETQSAPGHFAFMLRDLSDRTQRLRRYFGLLLALVLGICLSTYLILRIRNVADPLSRDPAPEPSRAANSATQPALPPIPGNWRLVFQDEFDTDPYQRGYVKDLWGLSQDANQAQHWNAKNATVAQGLLRLTARKEAEGGKAYTSGQIHSGGDLAMGGKSPPLFSFKFGYIECRLKVPSGKGLWPTFWMLPTPAPDFHDGDGEIDILDNGDGDPSSICASSGKHGKVFRHDAVARLSRGFHVLGLDWQPDHVGWYLDGKQIMHTKDQAVIPQVDEYFILGLQINDGKLWGPAPDAGTPFPSSMEVDYVRVWQKIPN
jgi:beta-glucanase (GH16 family)